MKIGFDAKRAFRNTTGLGNYSRTLIRSLATYFPENQFELYTTHKTDLFPTEKLPNITVITPEKFPALMFRSAWRSKWVVNELLRHKVNIYHGLSHEIPRGIEKTKIKTVVTIHDLIHELFPEYYSAIDRKIYSAKFRHACENADRIIAISENTKKDIVELYKIDPDKIKVIYQAADKLFLNRHSEEEKKKVKEKYNLPDKFILSVGSIIKRKNLLQLCKGFQKVNSKDIKLVVIGDGKEYKSEVISFLDKNNIRDKVIFLNEKFSVSFDDLPAIYQLATASAYLSSYEGFGLPVLESLMSGTPVIASNLSSVPEAGGDAPIYVDPENTNEITKAIELIITNAPEISKRIESGLNYIEKFEEKKLAGQVMELYKEIL